MGAVAEVCSSGEIGDLAGDNFFHLGGHEHGGEADELEVGLVDELLGQVEVEVVEGEVEGLSLEVKLGGYFHHPVDEDCPHVPGDFLLAIIEVVRIR